MATFNTVHDFGYTTLEQIAETINESDEPNWLAASYAYNAARDENMGHDIDSLEAHLDYLAEAGANFDSLDALAIAKRMHGAELMFTARDWLDQSQAALAKSLGLTPDLISKVERAVKPLQQQTRLALESLLRQADKWDDITQKEKVWSQSK